MTNSILKAAIGEERISKERRAPARADRDPGIAAEGDQITFAGIGAADGDATVAELADLDRRYGLAWRAGIEPVAHGRAAESGADDIADHARLRRTGGRLGTSGHIDRVERVAGNDVRLGRRAAADHHIGVVEELHAIVLDARHRRLQIVRPDDIALHPQPRDLSELNQATLPIGRDHVALRGQDAADAHVAAQ